ncbi:MAG: redoxin domain-containing protein [Pirellulales bacterium]|nr:redoxin domain-containing protein [Pirellulales bacterium]
MLTLLAVLAAGSPAYAVEANRSIGREVPLFNLPDHHGNEVKLDAVLSQNKLVVVAFLGIECPLAKIYAPRLQELANEFGPQGVGFLAIDSNQQDSLTEMGHFIRQTTLALPWLKDGNNVVADAFGAERTPQVFVIDAQRRIRYRGRIDDQYGLHTIGGYARPEVTRRDLAIALEELLAGKEVSQPETQAMGCLIGRVAKVAPHGEVTYSNQVVRILQNRCQECHRPGEVAPFALLDYDEVVGWAEMMREVVNDGRMPPWSANPEFGHYKNDPRLSAEEKQLINEWVANGCPRGEDSDLPAPREFVQGWKIGQPDQVVYMDDEAFEVPAEGVVDYQYFTADPGFTEDKWVMAAEARPDNPAVVHHIIVFITDESGNRSGGMRGGLAGYAPGMPPQDYPDGVALFVPKGSKLTFQMHYTPNGTAQKDRSYVGIKFIDPKLVKRTARGGVAGNVGFKIPPGDDNYEVTAKYRFRRDSLLLSMTPHMHLRGKSFRYEAEYPDGTREVLLDVPHYDFNWQLRYDLAEPKLIPKGTRIHTIAHFDNSDHNPANPDPADEVRFGDQTWEEMMFGFFTTIDPNQDVQQELAEKTEPELGTGDGDGVTLNAGDSN